tara:strand:+ start:16976 stop:17452 length:477 start_codon:yes stop_codon:yes gene_type:complete
MSVYKDVLDFAGGKRHPKDWYRVQVMQLLQPVELFDLRKGDVIFYPYQAETAEKLPWWDKFPLMMITYINFSNNQLSGGNLHYLRPEVAVSIGANWKAGARSFPMRCYHKYFLSNAGTAYKVPKDELDSIGKLPLEQFTTTTGGYNVDIPSSFVWSRM